MAPDAGSTGGGTVMSGMHALRLVLAVVIGVLVPAHSSHSAPIPALAIDPLTPTTLYAGTYGGGGLFKSTDGGANWVAVGSLTYISDLAIDPLTPTTLYAGTLGIYWGSGELTLGGVYKSTNRGASWSPVMLFDPGPLWYGSYCSPCGGVLALAIDPLIPTTLYGGTEAINVYDEWGESFRQWPQSGKVQLSSLA